MRALSLHSVIRMPACLSRAAAPPLIIDAAAFDFSDSDEVDIGNASPQTIESRQASATMVCEPRACEPRADRADDVLAVCALWVFKDRRRRTARGAATRALPGL